MLSLLFKVIENLLFYESLAILYNIFGCIILEIVFYG